MLSAGSIFGGYRIERYLGLEDVGEVYLARHPRLPRSDALTVISEPLSHREAFRERFRAEADVARHLEHEALVAVYDRGEADGRLCLATEYVQGASLLGAAPATGSAVDVPRVIALVEQLASGLDALHAAGLLHLQVTPGNVLVVREGVPQERFLLTGFGLARGAAMALGLAPQTPEQRRFAAPEQLTLRSDELDQRADVFALGRLLSDAFPDGPPASLVPVIATALAERREARYASAGDLAAAARDAFEAGVDGPFRIGVRHGDEASPAAISQFGPISSERLEPQDAHRLEALIGASRVMTLPPRLGGSGPATVVTIESPGRFHTVAWNGEPSQALAALVADVQRLAAPAPDPSAGEEGAPGPARPFRRRRWLAGLAIVIVLAGAGVGTYLLWGRAAPTPGAPASISATAGRGTVLLRWRPGTGKTDHYVVFRDGRALPRAIPATTYTVREADTKVHRFAVQAVNKAGRMSALSTVVTIAAEVRELNAGERRLVSQLPTALVNDPSCKPILFGADPRLQSPIICRPGADQVPKAPAKLPQLVEAYQAPTAAILAAVLNDQIASHQAKNGSCAAIPEAGTWNYGETPTVVNGQIICYADGGRNYLLWSYAPQRIYLRISTTAPYSTLYKYWQGAAIHLP